MTLLRESPAGPSYLSPPFQRWVGSRERTRVGFNRRHSSARREPEPFQLPLSHCSVTHALVSTPLLAAESSPTGRGFFCLLADETACGHQSYGRSCQPPNPQHTFRLCSTPVSPYSAIYCAQVLCSRYFAPETARIFMKTKISGEGGGVPLNSFP
jgi:hypothetical protein